MKWEVKTISLTKLIVTPHGAVTPLCQSCKTLDCSHQIENRTISVFGVNKKMRCLISGNDPYFVIGCNGHSK